MSDQANSSQSKNVRIGLVLAVLGTLLFSLKSIFIKFLYQQGLNADEVLVLRMALALPIYSLILLKLTQQTSFVRPSCEQLKKIILLGFFGYYLASLFDLMGLELISAQLERLSLFTYPFLIAVIGFVVFKEMITTRLTIAMIVSYLGLWIVMGEELKITGNDVILGVGLVLVSAFSFACYVLFSKRFIKQIGSQLFTSIAMIASCLFGLFHGVIVLDWATLDISTIAWFWLLMLVIFSTVIPSFMMTEALQWLGPAQVGVVGMLGPVFTIAFAIYLLNEPFTLTIALGIALIMLGVMAIMIKPH